MKTMGILAAVLCVVCMLSADVFNVPVGKSWKVDTIFVTSAETTSIVLATRELSGGFQVQYVTRSLDGDVKVKMYIYESLDTAWGWYNGVKICSLSQADGDSAKMDYDPQFSRFLRAIRTGFGSDGDTTLFYWRIDGIRSE